MNKAYRGRRFKTNEYKAYEEEVFYQLPKLKLPKDYLKLIMEVGVSKASDVDNVLKPFIDILQKKYNFNDNSIYSIEITKIYAPKGKEYIKFELL